MEDPKEPYTMGQWAVKPGREKEFIATWKEFADWTRRSRYGMIEASLLQDTEDPHLFRSYGNWEDADSINEWRQTPEWKKYYSKLKGLCQDIQIRTLKSVAHVEKR